MAQIFSHRGRSLLLALLLVGTLPTIALAKDQALDEADWTSPAGIAADICQGNGGSRSHTDERSFYAWDYKLAEGTPIVAARDGTVIDVVDTNTLGGADPRFQDMANRVVIKHADGLRSVYAHLKPGGACVRVGERVIRGERIGYSGNTGYSSGPHLHFAVVDSQGISVPIHFADFSLGDGVPWEGDEHVAGPKPELPQKDIDTCRAKLRAADAALKQGWPEVALLVIGKHRPRRARADHPLNLEVAGMQAQCADVLLALAEQVDASPEPDAEMLFRLVRANVAADLAKAPRNVRDRIHAARRALKGDAAKEAASLKTPATRLVKGMASECLEEEGAAKAYAGLLTHGKASIRELARVRFDHLVETALATYGSDVARLKESAREVGPQHERGLLLYAEATLEVHRSLLEQAVKARSDRATELKAALKRIRTDRKELATLLG